MPWWYKGKRIDDIEEFEMVSKLIERGELSGPYPEFHFRSPEHTERTKRNVLERFGNK
jgi:hypothetical protein